MSDHFSLVSADVHCSDPTAVTASHTLLGEQDKRKYNVLWCFNVAEHAVSKSPL